MYKMLGKLVRCSLRKIIINPVKFYHNKSDCHMTVSQGKMKGKVCSTPCGKQYYSFEGIPYAKPPLGSLRFRDPQKVDNWSGVLDATKPGNKAVQINFYRNSTEGSEDCLYLNVYTPILEEKKDLPVVFYVHGGNLYTGCGHMYRPDYFMREDVILVTINYRLNVFGFLDLQTPQVPGNAGIKDAATALKWVKNNIQHFNGDVNNITGMGESVGAIIITLLLTSKMTQGIFNKIIGLSTPISDFMIADESLERAKTLASHFGNVNDTEDVYNLLRNASPEDLSKALLVETARVNVANAQCFLKPTLEMKYDNVEPFMVQYPLEVLRNSDLKKVPALMSMATHEATYFITPPSGKISINKNIMQFVPKIALEDKDAVELLNMEKQLKELYFQDKEIGPATLPQYLDMASDFYVSSAVLEVADIFSMNDDFYFCRFAYNAGIMKKLGVKGATHSDILRYIFYTEKRWNTYNEQERIIVNILTEALCNFAKTGKPTWTGQEVSWPRYKKGERVCLNIDDSISCLPLPEYDRYSKFIKILNQKPRIRNVTD